MGAKDEVVGSKQGLDAVANLLAYLKWMIIIKCMPQSVLIYLVCGSEGILPWHILDIIGQSLVGKDVGIFVYFVHSIFES